MSLDLDGKEQLRELDLFLKIQFRILISNSWGWILLWNPGILGRKLLLGPLEISLSDPVFCRQ